MFGKKLLSVVSTLFIGSQLITMSRAAALSACLDVIDTACNTPGTPNAYCIDDKGAIRKYILGTNTESDDCATSTLVSSTAGIYAFEGNTKNVFAKGESSETVATENNVSLYQCLSDIHDVVSCAQTYGYFVIGTNYYTINKSGTNTVVDTGSTEITATCSSSTVGQLIKADSDIALCLDGSKSSQKIDSAASKTYALINKAGNVFTTGASNTDQYLIIQASKNAFTLVSNSYDYCVKEGEVVSETFKEICGEGTDADPCHTLEVCECTAGLCRRAQPEPCKMKADGTTNGKCTTPGYYLLNTKGTATNEFYDLVGDETEDALYYCEGANSCTDVKASGFKKGYYPNAASTGETDSPYIECTANDNCKLVDVDSDCTTAGSIVYDLAYKICLDKGATITPVAINIGSTSQTHFLSLDNASVFGSQTANKYVQVEAANGVVLLADSVASPQTYKYTDVSYKVHAKADNSAICSAATTIIEFKVAEESTSTTNLYDKHAEYKSSA